MRKGFIVRDRSLSSLPSKQLSAYDLRADNSKTLLSFRSRGFQQSKILSDKEQDIVKLKTQLDHAMKLAVNQAIQSSKSKQQTMRTTKTKIHIEKKYLEVAEQLNQEKQHRMKVQDAVVELEYELNKQQQEKKKIAEKQQHTAKQFDKVKRQLSKIAVLEQRVTEIQPLKMRVKTLELAIRNQKLKSQQIQSQNKLLLKQIEDLKDKLKSAKPYQQELLQRIAFLERVNLELQRKMQDFNRRQHEYKKQVQHYKTSLVKMTADRNQFKTNYQSTYATLQEKLEKIGQLQDTLITKNNSIQQLTVKLNQKTEESAKFSLKLQQTIDFYKSVAEQNQVVKKKLTVLQQNEQQMRRVLNSHLKVSEEINLYIVNRNSEIMKLEDQKKTLIQNLDVLQKKFVKLDRLFEEGSARGHNQIKQSYYGMLKQKNKLVLEAKQAKQELASKILQFGQERDNLQRKIAAYEAPIPKDQTLWEAIIADKIELILLIESSNDQLIKTKKQLQQRVRELEKEYQNVKKQMYNLRLKAAQLFKTKKDLQESRSKIDRYQQMIGEQKNTISDLNSQLDILRAKNAEVAQINYTMSMQNKNLSFKITEFQGVMKQLDVQYLNAKKAQNQKNAHILTDSIQKLQNGINSLAYYFSCCFCGELLSNPVTLAVCGHNYCTKCKDAYAQYCYECDTGQQIERIYSSKYLKDTAGKYKFLVMVVKDVQINLIKINPT